GPRQATHPGRFFWLFSRYFRAEIKILTGAEKCKRRESHLVTRGALSSSFRTRPSLVRTVGRRPSEIPRLWELSVDAGSESNRLGNHAAAGGSRRHSARRCGGGRNTVRTERGVVGSHQAMRLTSQVRLLAGVASPKTSAKRWRSWPMLRRCSVATSLTMFTSTVCS